MMEFATFPELPVFGAMAALVCAAAFVQGVGGVGFAMFASPVAAIVFPELVPGPLLTLGGCVALLTALRENRSIVWTSVGSALIGRGIGTLVAIYAMTQLSPQALALSFAGSILLAVALSAAGMKLYATPRNVCTAGIASGVMGTLTSVGAPPLAIVLQHTAPANLRATLGLILFFGSSFSLTMLALTGHYRLDNFLLSLALLPFMFLGFSCSSRMHKKISPVAVRRCLLAFCAASALALAIKALWG